MGENFEAMSFIGRQEYLYADLFEALKQSGEDIPESKINNQFNRKVYTSGEVYDGNRWKRSYRNYPCSKRVKNKMLKLENEVIELFYGRN